MPVTIGRREIAWVLIAAVLVAALTMVPYLRAIQLTPAGHQFSGFIWGGDDGNAYLSWIRQASQGQWLLRNQYTTKEQNPHFFNILLVALGKICALTGLAPIIVFHAARLLASVFLLYAFYLLVAELTENRRVRATALALAAVSSGLGWIVYLQVRAADNPLAAAQFALRPMDVAAGWQVQPEAITFLTMLLNPLFATGMALLCVVFRYGLRAAREDSLHSSIVCGLVLLLLGNVHSYDIWIAYAALFVWLAISAAQGRLSWSQAATRYGLIVLLGLPGPLWGLYTARVDPAYRAKVLDTVILSAQPWEYAIGYGLVLVFAVIGAVYILMARRRSSAATDTAALSPELLFMIVWVVVGFALVYFPVSFQRKLIEGMHLPLCVLAAVGISEVIARKAHRWVSGSILIILLVVTTIPSNAWFVADCLQHTSVNNLDLLRYLVPPAYLTQDEVAGLQWLGDNTSPADVVLSSSLMGNHIPAHAPCKVVAGHWSETLGFERMLAQVGYFYSTEDPRVKHGILALTESTLVFYGPQERILQQGMVAGAAPGEAVAATDPAASFPELENVFTSGEVKIYRVVPVSRPVDMGP